MPKINFIGEGHHDAEAVKKVIITARLVKKGCLPVSELGKLKTFILSSESKGASLSLLAKSHDNRFCMKMCFTYTYTFEINSDWMMYYDCS